MRRSQFNENEILHLLYEAKTGVSVAEICNTAGVSLRTFYRWRRRFGGLNEPAVLQMKELAAENTRLRGLVSNLFDRLRDPAASGVAPAGPEPAVPRVDDRERRQKQAIRSAAENAAVP